ncbi:MAG: hypothetical protein ACXWDI_05170 [Nocardioides sp.]
MTSDVAPLPAGTRLLHIGPHKTGTTTLQAAFHQSRDALEAQGVHYAGRRAHSMVAAMAVSVDKSLPTLSAPPIERWEELRDEINASTASQVVVSSEFYADASPKRVAAIIDELGRDRVHVVVTLRALHRILPSQWQQYMQNRMIISYEDWLEEMLVKTDNPHMTPSFWRRHRHDQLIRRWAEEVGPDRLTVVVVDERDKTMLTSAFERLMSVEPGTLQSKETANRSLTFTEVETLREFNKHWRERGWSEADYTRLVRFGAARHLQERRPGPDEERLLTPPWAVERALDLQREMVAEIGQLGVRVIGDLESLADPTLVKDVGVNAPVTAVSGNVAARLASGLVKAVTDVPRKDAADNRVVGELEAAARMRPPGVIRPPARRGPAGAASQPSLMARIARKLRRG